MVDIAKITAIREKRKLSQIQAAERAGISPQQWNNIESGRTGAKRGVSLPTLEKIAKALGVKAKDLLK